MKLKIYLFSVVFIIFSALKISGQEIKLSAVKQIQSLLDEKASRTPAQKKMDSQLWYAIKMSRGLAITNEVPTLQIDVNKDANGRVPVEITAQITDALVSAISNVGGQITLKSFTYNRIEALIPLQNLEQISSLQEVKFISPQYKPLHEGSPIGVATKNKIIGETPFKRTTNPEIKQFRPGFEQRAEKIRQQIVEYFASRNPEDLPVGSVTSQGDVTHKAATARTTFSVNGSGVKIGIISDSYNSSGAAAANVTAGDLPGVGNPNGFTTPVTVILDASGTDEGRAMLQIVHDLAPGAQLFFGTANGGPAGFAQRILDLRTAGCDIICDDIYYANEPPFQDGIIAQAVNTVTAAGANYFGSCGNAGNKNDGTSGVWEGDFVDAGTNVVGTVPPFAGGTVHDFGGGVTNNQMTSTGTALGLFWSDPLGGSANDYDIFALNSTLTTVVGSSTTVQNGTQDPIELFGTIPAASSRLVIFKATGAAVRALHLNTFRGRLGISTNGQTHSHSSAAAAFAVAATPANSPFGGPPNPTGPFPGPFVNTNTTELFSSDGPRRHFYTAAGAAITPGNLLFGTNGGTVRQKPDITAADGVSTTVPGLTTFYGTSAAAPHAAAIAGLLKSFRPGLTPAQIRTALTTTAIDIENPGVDRDAGFGIVMALEALQSVAGPTVTIDQAAAQPDPTSASPINFTVVFSAPVTGFATGDVALSGTAGATTGTVTGSGTTYNVAVSGMTSNGTVIATVPAGVAIDGGSFGNNASTSTDNTVTFNLPAGPTVTINQAAAQADPTATSPINFTVVFSEVVTGFATGDVVLSGTAGATTATVTGSGTTYNVAVSGMANNGTVIATVPANVAINGSSLGNLASTSTDNTVTFNGFPSTVTINQAAAQSDPTPVSPINFTVVFNEAVTGFTTGDVTISGTAGATTGTVTGSGTTYNVAVSGMTGGGTVIANIGAGVAVNGGGVGNLASTSTDNTVTYLNTPPTVTINQAASQVDPTSATPINFTVVFNEPVTGFATGDVVISGTALPTTAVVTGSGAVYNVAVSGMSTGGTVIATIPANVANDIDGNPNAASTSTDNTVTFINCVLTCPANITVNNTPGQCGAIVNFAPTTVGGCGTITSVPASGSLFPKGTTTVTVTTASGATCTFTVTVNDTENPAFTSPGLFPERLYYKFDGTGTTVPNLATAPPAGTATATLVGLTQGSTGKCGTALVGSGVASQNLNTNWATDMTGSWTISFWLGANQVDNNPSYLFGDVGAGTFRCFYGGAALANNVLLRGGSGDVLITGVNPAATLITIVYNGTNTVVYKNGGSPQTYAVTFANVGPGPFLVGGYSNLASINGSLDEFSLYTRALTPAEVLSIFNNCPTNVNNCPANITVSNTPGVCGAVVNYTTPVGVDNCPGVTTTRIAGLASGSTFPIGTTTNTYRATDASGNIATCTFTVTVNDTQAPTFTCPANITTATAVGSCTAVVNYTAPATDNCPGVTVVRTVGPASGSAFPIGVTTITHVATDAAGNTSSCTFTVTVADGQLPVIGTQPANRTVCSGTVPTFSVVATNTTSYQWQIWNGTAWTNITGATSATLTLPAATTAMNDNSYRVIVTGLCSSVTSGFATLFVNPLPTVSLAAAGSPVLLPTQTTGLIATVNPTGGTFAWFKNGAAYTGPTTNLGVGDVGTYRFIYTDLNGCVSTSNDVVVSAQASGNFYITPNPNVGAFSIRFFNSPNESVTVSVYNSVGEKVLSKSVTTTALAYTKIDVDLGSKISGGIYLVEVHGSDGKLRGAKRIIVGHR